MKEIKSKYEKNLYNIVYENLNILLYWKHNYDVDFLLLTQYMKQYSNLGEFHNFYNRKFSVLLLQVFHERQRRLDEAAQLERHIMQAQARAMSADERELNRVSQSCDNYSDLGLPPGINNGLIN